MADLVAKFPVDRLVFTDEVFVFDRLWLLEFAKLLKDANLDVGFEASAHPATSTVLTTVNRNTSSSRLSAFMRCRSSSGTA